MAKLNPQKFTVEEFTEQQSWIGRLFSPLNQLLGELVQAFSNKINIEDNLFQEIREIRFKNSSNNFPYVFGTKFGSAPKGLMSIYLFNSDTGVIANETPLVVWSYTNQDINISSISGLTADTNYILRLLIIYG